MCRTCCYWFCGSNGAGRGGGDSIGRSGFWAIIERKIWSEFRGECEDVIAGKPAPTGFCVVHNVGYTTEHCGSWLASDGASPDTTTFSDTTKSPPIGGLLVFTG
ncbi:hypothetical protein EJA70_02255 [Pseudomonas sp. PB103]|nr:hypothetical protein EJA70_02255 [Pseudomonas sp. PB103]